MNNSRWIYDPVSEEQVCPVCGARIDSRAHQNFCGNCGAQMVDIPHIVLFDPTVGEDELDSSGGEDTDGNQAQ